MFCIGNAFFASDQEILKTSGIKYSVYGSEMHFRFDIRSVSYRDRLKPSSRVKRLRRANANTSADGSRTARSFRTASTSSFQPLIARRKCKFILSECCIFTISACICSILVFEKNMLRRYRVELLESSKIDVAVGSLSVAFLSASKASTFEKRTD